MPRRTHEPADIRALLVRQLVEPGALAATRCARCRSRGHRAGHRVRAGQGAHRPQPPHREARESRASMRSRTRPPSRPRSRQPGESPMLENEVALVTGASRGIGHAIALALGGAGARVIGTATSAEGAAKLERGAHVARMQRPRRGAGRRAMPPPSTRSDRGSGRGGRDADHPGEQRRHHPRHAAAAHEAGGLGRGHRHQPDRGVPPLQGVRAAHDEGAARPHRQPHLGRGRHRQRRAGQLRRRQGRHPRLHQVARQGARLARHHRERGGARASSTPT